MKETRPWFKMYPLAFLDGTANLTLEEIGLYTLALCKQWDNGSIPKEPAKFAKSLRRSPRKVSRLMAGELANKFKTFEENLKNERLEEERQLAIGQSHNSRINGTKGGRPKTQRVSSTKPYIDVDIDVDIEEEIDVDTASLVRDKVRKYIKVNPKLKKWATDIEALKNKHALTNEQVVSMFEFISGDDWLTDVIQSPGKLLENNKQGVSWFEIVKNRASKKRESSGEKFSRQIKEAYVD